MVEVSYFCSLFGSQLIPESVRAESAAHPLIAPPVVRPRAQPRDYTSRAGVNDLLRDIQQMRTPESMAALDALMTSHRANGQVPVQIDMHADADHIGIRIDGRTFNLTRPAANAPPPDITSEFLPRQTMSRWLEEWNVIPGCDLPEQSARLVMHIVNRLMPEAKKAAEQAEEEAAKKAAEDEKKAEEERKEREEQERKEEAEAEQKKAEEERLRAEAEAEAARVAAEATRQAAAVPLPESRSSDTPQPPAEDVEMAETSEAGPSNAAPEPAEPAQVATRTVIQIHGRDVDITDTGIDLDFLEALPDDLRADVVDQHMRERDRVRRPAATGADPESELSEDFLNALPPEIQAELLMQEAMEGARRQAAQAPAVAAPAASTGAAPRVRPAQAPMPMPRAFLEQARQRLEQIGERAGLEIPGGGRLREIMEGLDEIMAGGPGAPRAAGRRPAHNASRPHREALQLLDKHGIASLVRLLFFPGGPSEESLFNILIHLCENTTTRSDLLNLLISVVQDGSGDLLAVDRSFQQMSIKAMATPKATPKVRIPDTPGASGSNTSVPIFSHLSPEHVPAFIAQRCFDALLRIVQSNTLAINFFLTEHEQPVGLKKVVGKKGKGKEKMLPQTRFPIVILLGLLDRPVLLKTSAMMEAFTGLLAVITRPLATLKETQDAEAAKSKEGESVAATDAAPAVEASSATPARPSAVTPGAAVATPAVTAATSAPPTESAAAKPPSLTKPPTIPAPVLRLVVNCLTGECSSQTFSNALRVMRNLSSSAEAKEVILSELRAQCTALGKVLQTELDELAPALDSADAEAAMAKFTPASSSQAQLLRLLKTIDYLQTNKDEQQSDKAEEVKEDIFAAFDFGSMWKQLSKCLSIVENKGSTDQIAIALLPLVEALMVVCKYHSETGELFTSFTTAHRKVLNAIVRNKPTLLSGSFSLLVRNPRVLEFDNKRNWFFQQLKKKKDQVHVGSMHLNVRRQYVFEDSFHAIQRKSGEEFKYAKLNVKFTNEDGIDATGLTREWYSVLAKQIFDPNFGMSTLSAKISSADV
jgi:E3 ubiquitin-protein ligase HUWE1